MRAYWIRDLDEVQTKAKSAEAAARRSTKQEWFTGAQGKKLREDDIMWLTETFSRVEPPPGASHLELPNLEYARISDCAEDPRGTNGVVTMKRRRKIRSRWRCS